MSQPYVPIRPARPAVDDALRESPIKDAVELLPKRPPVPVACEGCRKKRVRCDGQRPTCSNCRARNSACAYRDGRDLSSETRKTVVEIMQMLGKLAAPDAMRAIAALATENDATVILSTLRNGTSSSSTPGATGNDNQNGPSEFAVQNPVAYPPTLQAAPEKQKQRPWADLSPVFAKDDDFIDLLPTGEFPSASSTHETQLSIIQPSKNQQSETVPGLCDTRLQELNIRLWTPVEIDNDIASRCISLYLQTDHPLLGHFDPDLFVSHLVAGRGDCCSPLLVNALLYWACQMYSCVEPLVDGLTMPFCTEAERLWQIERNHSRDTVVNIAAAELICLGYLGQGRDHAILRYVSDASQMGIRMGLFGIEDTESDEEQPQTADVIDDRDRSRSYAAWGVFNWITLMSLFYRQPGLFCPRYPPRLPIPDYKLSNDHDGGTPQRPSSRYMGNTFPYLCRFWHIVHEVSLRYYGDRQQSWGSRGTMAFAEYKFRELLAWSNSLPHKMSQGQNNPHHVQILHLWFHAAILDIFRPCMHEKRQQEHRLRTFGSKTVTPRAVCDASIAQLKHLISDYRQQYSSSRYTFLWHTALIYVINAILNEKRDANWYADLLVCLYGYESLGRSWRVASSVGKSLLSLALRKGILSGRTATLIHHDLQGNGGKHVPEEIRATFMADLSLAMSDPDSATVEELAGQFDAHVYLKDFTTVLDDAERTETTP